MHLDKFQLRQIFELCRCGSNEGIVAKAEIGQFGEGSDFSRQRALCMKVKEAGGEEVSKRPKMKCKKH